MRAVIFVMQEAGCKNVPSLDTLRRIQKELNQKISVLVRKDVSSRGNIYYTSDLATQVEQDFSDALNPAHRGFRNHGTQFRLADQPARVSDVERLSAQVNTLRASVDRLQSVVTAPTQAPPPHTYLVSLLSSFFASYRQQPFHMHFHHQYTL